MKNKIKHELEIVDIDSYSLQYYLDIFNKYKDLEGEILVIPNYSSGGAESLSIVQVLEESDEEYNKRIELELELQKNKDIQKYAKKFILGGTIPPEMVNEVRNYLKKFVE